MVFLFSMHKSVLFNHKILPAEEVFLSAVSPAALYGRGIFTTIAIFGSKPFLWEKHWRRLTRNAEKLSIDLKDFPEARVKRALQEITETNRLERGRARLSFFDASADRIWSLRSNNKTHFLITTADFRKTKPRLRLMISPFRVNSASPLAGLKSCNYLENLLVLEETRKNGFDEAIRLNERGEVAAACLANVFWVKDGAIFTPAIETGCLAGTTRDFLRENFAVQEVRSPVEAIIEADEIFLASAGIGLCRAGLKKAQKRSESVFSEMKRILDLQKARA
jgi:branched-subunit amino acid aminotransferase/4-amino-4-deoxychorismate lyase